MPILHYNLLPPPTPSPVIYHATERVTPHPRHLTWSVSCPLSLPFSPHTLLTAPLVSTNRLSRSRTFTAVGLYDPADLVHPIVKVECGPQRSADDLCETRPDVTQPQVDLCVHPYTELSVRRIPERPFTDLSGVPVPDTQEVPLAVLGRIIPFLGSIRQDPVRSRIRR